MLYKFHHLFNNYSMSDYPVLTQLPPTDLEYIVCKTPMVPRVM